MTFLLKPAFIEMFRQFPMISHSNLHIFDAQFPHRKTSEESSTSLGARYPGIDDYFVKGPMLGQGGFGTVCQVRIGGFSHGDFLFAKGVCWHFRKNVGFFAQLGVSINGGTPKSSILDWDFPL